MVQARRRPRTRAGEPAHVTPGLVIATIVLAVAILLAPPESNYFWSMNALRGLDARAAATVFLAALASASLVQVRATRAWVRWSVAVIAAWVIAYPLREKIHFLGDTQLRLGAFAITHQGWVPLFGSWWSRLHANPLDIVVNVLGVYLLQKLGLSVIHSVSLVSWVLGVAFFAASWRLAGRLSGDPATRVPLTAALVLSGALESFAGYAESAGLVAVTAMWCWAEMCGPLSSRAQAWRVMAAFTALVLAHRVGIVMALPLLWRAAGPPLKHDRPEARHTLLILALSGVVLILAMTIATGAGTQLLADARDLLASARSGHIHPADVVNALVLMAPLALLAPFATGRAALAVWFRSPGAKPLLLALAPLLIAIVWLYPGASYSLGPHREWEANLLPGLTLTVAGGTLLAGLDSGRLRLALRLALPVLALITGSWLAVNADHDAALQRAFTLATSPSSLNESQLGSLHAYLGQKAMDDGRYEIGAREFERAFDLAGNARRALIACQAWLTAGDLAGARRALAKARARGALGAELERSAAMLDQMVARAADDSARAAHAEAGVDSAARGAAGSLPSPPR